MSEETGFVGAAADPGSEYDEVVQVKALVLDDGLRAPLEAGPGSARAVTTIGDGSEPPAE